MNTHRLLLLFLSLGGTAAIAQQSPGFTPSNAPRIDLSLGYNYIRANAPPSGPGRFSLNGGFFSASVVVSPWLSLAAEATGGRGNNISALGQNLTLFTVATGPRFSYSRHRLTPYGQVLVGLAHGSDSYFPSSTSFTTSSSTYAISTGGGLDYGLSDRYAIRVVNAEYLRTGFQNGSTNEQNQLMIGAGFVVRFNNRRPQAPPPAAPVAHGPGEISFLCGTDVASAVEGQSIQVTGHALTQPDQLSLDFTWTATGGKIQGAGRHVSLETAGLGPGEYRVLGRASLTANPSVFAECETPFRIAAPVVAQAPPSPPPAKAADAQQKDREFHDNVRDAHFDYNSAVIRPDALPAIAEAADYLKNHPGIRVLIQGYADERGSTQYNLALGADRANAARDALIAAGIEPGRLEIISYGKQAQVCTADTEACWQQNRRAAFGMHP